MVLLFFMSIILSFGLSLFVCPSPLLLGLWILMISLFSSFVVGVSIYSWFGILVFIIYVGGLLVMFSYFVALSPNQVYSGQSMLISLGLSLPTALTLVMLSEVKLSLYSMDVWGNAMGYFFQNNLFLFIFMGLSLFVAMVSVVKLCSCYTAPLRGFK